MNYTQEQLIAEIDRAIAEYKQKWPTIEDMPEWHPVRKLLEQIEADVLAEVAKKLERA